MKLKLSLEAVGWYLAAFVGFYNEANGVPPGDPREYASEVPELLALLRRNGDDAAFLRAALQDLVDGHSLTEKVAESLCGWSNMDVDREHLRPILAFMLQQIDEHVAPPIPDNAEVEFVSLGLLPSEWRPTQNQQSSKFIWRPQQHALNSHPSVVAPAPCPQTGFWFTAAGSGSRRHFKSQEVMPALGGDFGATIWQWDRNQSPPKLNI